MLLILLAQAVVMLLMRLVSMSTLTPLAQLALVLLVPQPTQRGLMASCRMGVMPLMVPAPWPGPVL